MPLKRKAFLIYFETNTNTDRGMAFMTSALEHFSTSVTNNNQKKSWKCHLVELFDGDNRITIGQSTKVNSDLVLKSK